MMYRITWKVRDTGLLSVCGVSLASNHGFVADDITLVDELNKAFPEIEFSSEYFSSVLNQWVPERV